MKVFWRVKRYLKKLFMYMSEGRGKGIPLGKKGKGGSVSHLRVCSYQNVQKVLQWQQVKNPLTEAPQ